MESTPRVSVIIAIYNAGLFLAEAIESVRAQSFAGWELLLVDDGSTDGSEAIARGYAERYPGKVRYLHHPMRRRRGQGAARNLGIGHAAGEFIAILDHDDLWLPHKLERQIALLDAGPEAALVCGVTRYWRSWAGHGKDYDQSAGVPPNRVYGRGELLKPTLSEQIIPPIPTDFMFRKKSIVALGAFEEAFIGALSLFEDQAFLIKVYANLGIFVADECWDLYRIHPEQHCARVIRAGRKPEAEYFFLKWAREYLALEGLLDMEMEALLRRRGWAYEHPWLARAARWKGRIWSKAGR